VFAHRTQTPNVQLCDLSGTFISMMTGPRMHRVM